MVELAPSRYAKVLPLFSSIASHRAIVYSVLERNNPGRVFVDNASNPRSAFLFSVTEFFYFAGDETNAAFMEEMRNIIFNDLLSPPYSVSFGGFTPAWKETLDRWLTGMPGGWANRAELDFPPKNFAALQEWRTRIPDGYRIAPFDPQLAGCTAGIEQLWNGAQNFMDQGAGYAVLEGDEIVSSCFMVVKGAGEAEISVDTHEAHRRRGLAQLCVSAFVETCLQRGLRPHWTCWADNLASLKLAQSLGFTRRSESPVRYVDTFAA